MEMVKDDFLGVDVAQSKYGYSPRANDRADRDLAWTIGRTIGLIVDFLVKHDSLVTLWELLQFSVDVDEYYAPL